MSDLKKEAIQPDENFDWNKFEHGIDAYTPEVTSELDALYSKTLTSIKEKEVMDKSQIAQDKNNIAREGQNAKQSDS